RLASLTYPQSALLAMTTAARNAPLMIGLTGAVIPERPLVTTAIVVGMLIEFPHLLAVRHLLLRRHPGT
ncbi:arsenic resistance protein, partial [Bacillus sp. S34]|nr:arsenic resistance protein [Bacillus sp. S34]